jgi:hypothetical protein
LTFILRFFFGGPPRQSRNLERGALRVGHLDLHLAVVEMALLAHPPKTLARGLARLLAGQGVEQPLHRRALRRLAHRPAAALAFQADGLLDKIARNLLDVAADIADLGEFGRLHLHKRRVGELGETARNLGLAAPGRADHQDVLRRHLVAQRLRQLLPPPAIAQRHRDRALGVVLPDDMLIERGHHRLGGEAGRLVRHGLAVPVIAGGCGHVVHRAGDGRQGRALQRVATREGRG